MHYEWKGGGTMNATDDIHEATSLTLSPSACIGCGICMVVCPRGVFSTVHGKAAIADRDACIECGDCMVNCPVSAITVFPAAKDYMISIT